jgi:preprotein translocase subunit SecA
MFIFKLHGVYQYIQNKINRVETLHKEIMEDVLELNGIMNKQKPHIRAPKVPV